MSYYQQQSLCRTSTIPGVVGCPSCGVACGPSGIPLCRFECEPQTLEPGTSAPVSSSSAGELPALTIKGNYNSREYSPKAGDGLHTALHRKLPALTANGYGSNQGGENPGPARQSLQQMARTGQLPTLIKRDWRVASHGEGALGRKSPHLPEIVSLLPGQVRGPLHPSWCEVFMGFPEGWTLPPESNE